MQKKYVGQITMTKQCYTMKRITEACIIFYSKLFLPDIKKIKLERIRLTNNIGRDIGLISSETKITGRYFTRNRL